MGPPGPSGLLDIVHPVHPLAMPLYENISLLATLWNTLNLRCDHILYRVIKWKNRVNVLKASVMD